MKKKDIEKLKERATRLSNFADTIGNNAQRNTIKYICKEMLEILVNSKIENEYAIAIKDTPSTRLGIIAAEKINLNKQLS
ncbi:MAG: hypothetical protein ABFD07_11510 [Methanobacterium sp.]